MAEPELFRPFRGLRTAVVVALVASVALAAAGPAQTPEEDDAGPGPGTVPPYLRGIDLTLPSQEAFRDWPGDDLRLRPYWLPWSVRSFQRARLFDRPVFFVLTVDWSRRSQKLLSDTLADRTVLTALNDGWTTVLVNADRRPDIRERYQTGTWPVVAFLLPDGHPMLSTANPQGMAQPITTSYVDAETMLFLLREGRLYYDKWSNVLQGVGDVWAEAEGGYEPVAGEADEAASDGLVRWLLANADRQDGGFGAAPKFVHAWLADYGAIRDARLLPALFDHARLSAERLASSPLYDDRDGGVHRIATAPSWGNVQYEKLLSRNVDYLRELVTVLRMGGDRALETPLRGTARFLVDVLGRPQGGFYLAQVADPATPDGGGYWNGGTTPPPVDRMVLSGPNALAGASLLRAGAWLDDDALARAGRAALDLVLERAYRPGRGVDHVIEPSPDPRRYLETQADVSLGLLDAYESTGDARYLDAAEDIVGFALANLADADAAALRDHLPERVAVGILANPRRPLDDNARLARALVRLDHHGRGPGRDRAVAILRAFAGGLTDFGVLGIEAGLAIEETLRDPLRVTLVGPPDATRELRRAALRSPWGWTLVATETGGERAMARVEWRGDSVEIDDPGELSGAIRRITGLDALPIR